VHFLIVEDDPRLGRVLDRLFTTDRHVVELVTSGSDALATVDACPGLDAIVLDIGLPDRSGLEVCRTLRERGSRVPVLMLTARDGVPDRVAGLDAGADDYMVKPFAYEELSARLRALARRGGSTRDAVIRVGPITLVEATRAVTVDDVPLLLSQREFALLEVLLRHPDQVLSRDQLLDHAWPMGVAVTPNSVDAYVSFVRRKLGPAGERLQTVRGVGYRMVSLA
jgi:DNA-binding response OmpR family regulator